jgi:hypothetical protein
MILAKHLLRTSFRTGYLVMAFPFSHTLSGSMRRFVSVRGQRHCATCGHIQPLAWPADKETCQTCQDAVWIPCPPRERPRALPLPPAHPLLP